MTTSKVRWQVFLLSCMSVGLLATSCVSDDYNLKNVDLTVGLGSDGLGVRLGKTEKIHLDKVITIDENVREDANHLYYIEKKGSSDFTIDVDAVTAEFEETNVECSNRVLSFDDVRAQKSLPDGVEQIPITTDFRPHGEAEGESTADFSVDNITSDLVRIYKADAEAKAIDVYVETVTSPNVHFKVDYIENFEIILPEFVIINHVSSGWKLEGRRLYYPGRLQCHEGQPVCSVLIDQIDMKDNGTPVNGSILFQGEMAHTSMRGDVYFCTPESFTMGKDDFADINLNIKMRGGNTINITHVTGVFDPVIDPEIEPIHISESLPDFLQDDDVVLTVNNPTLKFAANMQQIPLPIDFSALLTSITKQSKKEVLLPAITIDPHASKTAYYYQTDAPYDPTVSSLDGIETHQVSNLSTLIEKIPDEIDINLSDGRTRVKQEVATVALGTSYQAHADYTIFVPFEFNKGLIIVYTDSTNSIHDDIKDYSAKGADVSATVESTIPLELVANIKAIDVNGRDISGINFTSSLISASPDGVTPKQSHITLHAVISNPRLLQKVDKFVFSIRGEGNSDDKQRLVSTQYIQFSDVKVRLEGPVATNFN